MCKKNRIVIFLGAGFPIPWGAPSSEELYALVATKIKGSTLSFLLKQLPQSFEDVVAALYSYSVFNCSPFQQKLFTVNISEDVTIEEAIQLYQKSINEVMYAIQAYEVKCKAPLNQKRNEQVQNLFAFLETKYKHISVYTTNYDEMLPQILKWPDKRLSLSGDHYDYFPLKQHRLKYSYSNLHGSIHLNMSYYDGHQYEVRHSLECQSLNCMHELYGGNPDEFGLFSPIIVGHSKTQQLMSKHQNFVTTCFANDLSDCDTILAIGSSFSDPHVNAIIRQYTHNRKVHFRIVIKDSIAYNSSVEKNFSKGFIGYNEPYFPDTKDDTVFERENGDLVYYKLGTDSFLEAVNFWEKYL